jgi:heme exporter protein B
VSAPLAPPSTFQAALLVARKDLSIEFRTRTAFMSALVFALLSIVIFYFAWDPTAVGAIDLAPGVLWIIFTFSGLLGLQRSFNVELAERAIDGLLAAPITRQAIYLGKAIANLVFVAAIQIVAIPTLGIFYDVPLGGIFPALAGIALLAAIGIVAVGTLFASMTVNSRMAELLLPMLALPFFVPILLPAAQATAKLLAGRPVGDVASWLKVLAAFDIVFVTACVVAFPYTIEE